jgi:DNA-binding LytR/AlgR family response regulator
MTTPRTADGLRVLVVDDERPALEELAFLLERDDRITAIATCESADNALRILRDEAVDALFVDIAMPGLSGIELAEVLRQFKHSPPVIFVTAHMERAVDAFDLNAVDFVLKPVREERLREAVRRIHDERTDHADPDDTIAVELAGVTRFVDRAEIRYVEAQGDYARLHTAGASHLVRMPIGTLEERWAPAGFLRIHRSFLVALAHVDEVRDDGGQCRVVIDGRELQVSRRHTPILRDLLRRRRRGEPAEAGSEA